MRPRYIEPQVRRDLARKMVFVAGPRQVGKTTLARRILGRKPGYLNWDAAADREAILRGELPASGFWVFDEIHKYPAVAAVPEGALRPRGVTARSILVTGSARLDFYRHGGDSLQGRYHLLRMHPLSAGELGLRRPRRAPGPPDARGLSRALLRGATRREARRWSREYRNLLVREELTSLERVTDLGRLELLMVRLPALVGSPLSVNALREDLQVSHATVANWLAILERLYALFRVSPFGAPRIRAVK